MYEGVEMRSPVLNDSQNEPVNLMSGDWYAPQI